MNKFKLKLDYSLTILKIILVPVVFFIFLNFFLPENLFLVLKKNFNSLIYASLLCQLGFIIFVLRFYISSFIFELYINFFKILTIHYQSLFYFFVLPSSYGQDFIRVFKILRFIKKKKLFNLSNKNLIFQSSKIIFFDRLMGIIALFFIGMFGLAQSKLRGLFINEFIISSLSFFVILIIIYYVYNKYKNKFKFLSDLKHIHLNLKNIYLLSIMLILSILSQLIICFSILYFLNNNGIFLNYYDVLAVMAISIFLQMIPLSFLGVSIGEVVGTSCYIYLGLDFYEALFPVLFLFFQNMIAGSVGGLLEIFESGLKLFDKDISKLNLN